MHPNAHLPQISISMHYHRKSIVWDEIKAPGPWRHLPRSTLPIATPHTTRTSPSWKKFLYRSPANGRLCRTFSDVRCEGDGGLEEASIGSMSANCPRVGPFQARSAQPVHSTPSTLPHKTYRSGSPPPLSLSFSSTAVDRSHTPQPQTRCLAAVRTLLIHNCNSHGRATTPAMSCGSMVGH
jgi:hypothetical protein